VNLLTAVLLWLLVLALLAHLLRRLPWLPGLVVAAGLVVLAWFLWRTPLGGETTWWGRSLQVDRTGVLWGFRLHLSTATRTPALLLLGWGALFALAGAWTRSDRVLFPVIPLILMALLLTLSSTPLLTAPFWLVVAVIFMAFAAQGTTPRLARGALRILLVPTLGFPVFLFASWAIGQPDLAVQDPALWVLGWRALFVALILLLTPVPLHGWIVSLGEHAPPLAAAFVVGSWQITTYALVRRILLAYPLIAEFADPARWLPWLAVIQMVWAGLFAAAARRLGQLWGYLLLWDYGASLLLWSLSGEFGVDAILGMMLARPLVLVVMATGYQALAERFGENAGYPALHGAVERLPTASLGLVGGGLLLLGWPLGALFPARMATLRLAATGNNAVFLGAMVALFLATVGLARVMPHLNRPLRDPYMPREAEGLGWLIWPLLLAGLLIALNPAVLDALIQTLALWLVQV
jgi:NADH:ubiquinone oxidoreductase subunit 2 (subunit N)